MKKYLWVGFPIVTLLIIINSIITIDRSREVFIEDFHSKWVSYQKMYKPKCIEIKKEEAIEESPVIEENVEETYQESIIEYSDVYTTRMTSFWANDGYGTGSCTGSGLCEWDFEVNEHGWYTYEGKLVVATATTYLANQGWGVNNGVHLYRYGDELTLIIDGVEYTAVVKDSCGNCMRTDRIDLFVSNGESAKDTMIEVRRN